VVRIASILGGSQIILNGRKRFALKKDATESIPLARDIDEGLVPMGFEVLHLEVELKVRELLVARMLAAARSTWDIGRWPLRSGCF
jgi:hypothetical protein